MKRIMWRVVVVLICTRSFGKNSFYYVGKMKGSIFPAATILDKINADGKFVTPPPLNQGRENGLFWLLRGFIFDFGGWGFAVPFYSVQDCSN